MLYAFALMGPVLGAMVIVNKGHTTKLVYGYIFLSIPTIFLYVRTVHTSHVEQVYFVLMQVIWLPLVLQDFKHHAVNALGLAVVTFVSVVATWLMIGIGQFSFFNAFFIVALFGTIHVIYRRFRGRDPFGLGDYPALFVLSLTLETSIFGLWIMLASLMGLAQAWGQAGTVKGSVAMIPLLYLSWQFCVTLG